MLPQILLCSTTIFFSAILIDKLRIYFFEKPVILGIKKLKEKFKNQNSDCNKNAAQNL